jgi:outer membrane protein OmpA-like peptidoglycan-associated protein
MELSEKRAKAVKSYLTNKGIDAGRISIIGYGDTKNEAPNNTPPGRAQNRRAVVVVLR